MTREELKEWASNEVAAYRHTPVVEAVRALLAERDELLALLREVEWSEDDCGFRFCPLCEGYRPGTDVDRLEGESYVNFRVGHAPDCRLTAALKGAG